MRFLGIGDTCDLGALYQRLLWEGHEVKVFVGDLLAQGTMRGLVDHCENWENELPWIREAGADGIILFENVAQARGLLQDELRADGYQVIGGSAFGDKLENDRAFAQQILSNLGLQTCRVTEFSDAKDAISFLDIHPGRYVLKFNGPGFSSNENYVGCMPFGEDIRAILQARLSADIPSSFVLMDHVDGVEMGVGAYFDGEKFVGAPCLDWEHKRFFPGNLGELTGEMGTVATFEGSDQFFKQTLHRVGPVLAQQGYCGYININTIVNERGIWPLEFTCRFGYPGFAVLGPLQETAWSDIFKAMVSRTGSVSMRDGFSVAIVLTIPPFPYDRAVVNEPVGLPVFFEGELSVQEMRSLYWGEVGMDQNQLVTSGKYGWTMVSTGTGKDIPSAQRSAYELANCVRVPNVRYRCDIGKSLVENDLARIKAWGFC